MAARQRIIPVRREYNRWVANQTLEEVRRWLNEGSPQSQHYGFPVMDEAGQVKGLVTLRALLNPKSQGTLTIGELVTHTPVMVNEEFIESVTPDKVPDLLARLA